MDVTTREAYLFLEIKPQKRAVLWDFRNFERPALSTKTEMKVCRGNVNDDDDNNNNINNET